MLQVLRSEATIQIIFNTTNVVLSLTCWGSSINDCTETPASLPGLCCYIQEQRNIYRLLLVIFQCCSQISSDLYRDELQQLVPRNNGILALFKCWIILFAKVSSLFLYHSFEHFLLLAKHYFFYYRLLPLEKHKIFHQPIHNSLEGIQHT